MIASTIVISNLLYLVGAMVMAVIGGLIVVLRHRKPKSVEANITTFSRGLRALAPEDTERGSTPAVGTARRSARPTPPGAGESRREAEAG